MNTNKSAITCQNPDNFAWDASFDVVVVGAGGAGVSAAIEASDQGCDVLTVDRFNGGGATAFSGGVYYAGATDFIRQAGFSDSVEEMYNYLSLEVGNAVSERLLKRFCADSPANINWLVNKGVQFSSECYDGKTVYPPNDKFLYYAGNEKVPAFAEKAKPAPRGHRVVGSGFTGKNFFAALERAMIASGVEFWRHAKAAHLIVDTEGSVVGVEIKRITNNNNVEAHQKLYEKIHPMDPFIYKKTEYVVQQATDLEKCANQTYRVRAKRGVIISTGAFTYNSEMLQQYVPKAATCLPALMRLGSIGCDGSGIALGVSVGGATDFMGSIFLGRNIAPPAELLHGVMVNKRGERFVNEDSYTGRLGKAILSEPDSTAWLIIDNKTYYRTLRQCLPNGDGAFKPYKFPTILNFLFGGTKKSRTIRGLSRKCNFSDGALEKTVSEHNEAIAQGRPDPMGKSNNYVRTMGEGPYRAINSAIWNKFSFPIFFTLGGLVVDEESGVVTRADGSKILGLYAAGRAAVGICADGYFSGLSLADCVFSGRRAAQDAARSNAT